MSHHEIEAKFKIDTHAGVRRRLRAAGADFLHTVLQTDRYFDTSEKYLLGRDCGLRIRTARCLHGGSQAVDTRPLLTAKGPGRPSSKAKIRTEVQTHLDSPEAVEALLDAFGLEPTLTIQKRRACYRLGRCRIELDELPLIGCFVEVEAPSEKRIAAVQETLHLPGEPILDHYIDLLLSAVPENAGATRTITFETFPSR